MCVTHLPITLCLSNCGNIISCRHYREVEIPRRQFQCPDEQSGFEKPGTSQDDAAFSRYESVLFISTKVVFINFKLNISSINIRYVATPIFIDACIPIHFSIHSNPCSNCFLCNICVMPISVLLLDDNCMGHHHVLVEGLSSSSVPGGYASKSVYLLGGERITVK